MPTPRKPTRPTTKAIDAFCTQFDDLFRRFEERAALRHYLIGLLLPREQPNFRLRCARARPSAAPGSFSP